MSAPTPADQLNDAIDRAAGPVLDGVVHGQADLTGGIVDAASDTATGYANAAGDVATGYANAGGDLANTAGQVFNDQVTAYSSAGGDLLDGFEHGDPLGGLVHAGGDLIVGDANEIGHILTGVAGAAADVGTGIFHGVEDVAGGLAKASGDVVTGVVKDFEDVGHGVLEGAAHGLKSLFGGGESKDEILKKFGHEDPEAVAASRGAAEKGKADLAHLASALNSGDTASVGTADELLRPGETGLAYFSYFLPAYNSWTGQQLTESQLRTAYEQEFGMSFSAYASDAELMSQVSTALTANEQALQNAYNALVPAWQGPAAANFEAKLSVFFTGASASQKAVSDAGAEVKALVEGLQKLVLAKAELVNGLYADTLDPGIDGAMAQTVVQVAQGQLHDDMRRVVLGIFHLAAHGRHGWDDDGYYSDDCLDDPSRQAAINAATAWCNNTLMPQTEARLKALSEVCVQTQQRIQQAFATLVEDLKSVNDPFVAMTTATAPAANTPTHGGGGGRPAGGGAPGGGSFTPPPSPTFPTSATGSTTPQGTGSSPTPGVPMVGSDPTGSDPTVGITRPAGLPAGAGWIPPGVPLPPGWSEDPSTGAVLPKGPIDPKHDIHKNRDGSVSLGADRGLTISPEKGRRGVFSLTDTDPDGTVHTYHVRFDQHGHPVVTEVVPKDGTAGLDDSAAPGSGVSGGVAAGTAAAAHAGPAGSPDLAQGAQVGSDDAMGAASIPTQASPVAGSAAAAGQQSGAHQGGAIGGMPMGAGMGRGAGGQEQEAARKYQQRGDVVGEDDLEEWQRMGPVIGEQ